MKWLKRLLGLALLLIMVVIIAVVIIINPFGPSPLNNYTRSGELSLAGLKEPVTVQRDEKGMAYIYAQNAEDLIMAQGFVAAQDRLFQMELIKLIASGRICELAGEKARAVTSASRWQLSRRERKQPPESTKPSQFPGRVPWRQGALAPVRTAFSPFSPVRSRPRRTGRCARLP